MIQIGMDHCLIVLFFTNLGLPVVQRFKEKYLQNVEIFLKNNA